MAGIDQMIRGHVSTQTYRIRRDGQKRHLLQLDFLRRFPGPRKAGRISATWVHTENVKLMADPFAPITEIQRIELSVLGPSADVRAAPRPSANVVRAPSRRITLQDV
jgi:hypothetical protein